MSWSSRSWRRSSRGASTGCCICSPSCSCRSWWRAPGASGPQAAPARPASRRASASGGRSLPPALPSPSWASSFPRAPCARRTGSASAHLASSSSRHWRPRRSACSLRSSLAFRRNTWRTPCRRWSACFKPSERSVRCCPLRLPSGSSRMGPYLQLRWHSRLHCSQPPGGHGMRAINGSVSSSRKRRRRILSALRFHQGPRSSGATRAPRPGSCFARRAG